MADSLCVDVGNRSKQLVGVQLDKEVRDHLFHLEILLHDTVGGIRNEVHHHIQVYFFRLVSIGVERLSHFDTVGMVQHFQNLQLSVLISLILEHLFDGYGFPSLSNCRFKHNSKRSISNDLLSIVSETLLKSKKPM